MDNEQVAMLIEQIRAGGPAAEAAWDAFGAWVFATVCQWARRWTPNWDDAQDVAQLTLVKVHAHLGAYDNTRPVSPWLYAIAKNTWRDLLAASQGWVELGDYLADEQQQRDEAAREQRLTLAMLERHLSGPEQVVLRSLLASGGDIGAAAAAAGLSAGRVYQIRQGIRRKLQA